jgi:hypothetical protein
MLKKLEHMMPASPEPFTKSRETYSAPDGFAASFKSDTHTTILEIMHRTQCHVQTSLEGTVDGNTNLFTSVYLYGTPSQREAACELLPSMTNFSPYPCSARLDEFPRQLNDHEGGETQPDTTPTRFTMQSPSKRVPIRAVWGRHLDTPRAAYRLNGFRPPLTSVLEMNKYIEDITNKLPRLERPRENYIQRLWQELRDLFADPKMVKILPPPAVDQACTTLFKHRMIKAARNLLDILQSAGYEVTTSNVDCFLIEAADAGDAGNFNYMLEFMLQKKLKTSVNTWVAFHKLVCNRWPEGSQQVMETMKTKGVFKNDKAVRQVMPTVIQRHITDHLAHTGLQGNLPAFFDAFDQQLEQLFGRPGYRWLTEDVAHRMCEVLLTVGQISDAISVLDEVRRRGQASGTSFGFSERTVIKFLRAANLLGDPSTTVALINRFRIGDSGAIQLGELSYSILLTIAWGRNCYNMVRVIWRYACAAGQVTNEMQWRVQQSVLAYAPSVEPIKRKHIWKAWAGKFAVGVTASWAHTTMATTAQTCTDLIQAASQAELENGSPAAVRRRSYLMGLFIKDLTEARQFYPGRLRPQAPFRHALEEAWRKDMHWKEMRLCIPVDGKLLREPMHHDFTYALANGLRVKMVPGRHSLRRTREVNWKFAEINRERE